VRADSLGGWLLRVFIWLVPAFGIWHLTSGYIADLQAIVAKSAANSYFPGLLSGWERKAASVDFITRVQALSGGRLGNLVFGVDARNYSYGAALFAALCLATDPRRLLGLGIGLAALIPIASWGVLFDLLQQVFIGQGALAARDYLPTSLERNFIAYAYQAGSILLPTAAPVIAWGVVHRDFLRRQMAP
jgi:hypothetical protein